MIFSGLITVALIIQIALGTNQVPYRIGIVTQEKVCSDIGSDMVNAGGKSIDAFIASSLCLSVVNPFSAGPGAGGFLLIRDHKHDKNVAINCFFKSSNELDKAEYKTNPVLGEGSVGVPGEFSCINEVYRYARFNWKKLTKPAIDLATKGFTVSRHLAEHLKELDLETDIKANPYLAEMYLKNGELVKENDVIRNIRLARTLEKLRNNPEDLYTGGVGDSIVEGSKLTKQDLRDYTVNMNDVSRSNYRDFVVLTAPFPSNGPIVAYALKLMETLNLQIEDFKKPEFFTHLLQAAQMGYKMSAYTADPASTTVKAIYEEALK
jgi:gamma-glutamyltranspeptidase/glutathione hydrolase/leukotriene-C4 hydrolase